MEDLKNRTEFDPKNNHDFEWKQVATNDVSKDKLAIKVNFKLSSQDNAIHCRIYLGDEISSLPYLESPPLHIRKSGILFFFSFFSV